jgi:hypothetical protein
LDHCKIWILFLITYILYKGRCVRN